MTYDLGDVNNIILSWKYSQYAYQTNEEKILDWTKKYVIIIYNKDDDKFYVRNFIYENTFDEKSWYYEDGIDKIFTVNDPKNLIKENDPNNENNFYMVEYINTTDFQTLFPLIIDLISNNKILSYEISSLKNDITDMALEIKHIKEKHKKK
jgi:hypothetical protein